ncbi:hypothetical protein BDM02DRAFT_2343118 [Thelephora ganbajun]|uniref:Uncharacterized protein n=1 Tax=Thelephora ganbajun TaxID=370292 RepID=A0ACB6ZFH3_THEGA|nr:hypothetical protein BDM02DRAFT_2343118 [Thelephora ganbajun]
MGPATGVKRKRMEAQPAQVNRPTVKQLALREIELEIAIKRRMVETIEARMAWALFLQKSLQNESTVNASLVGANEFRDAALEALDAIERPCNLILAREPLFASAGEPSADNCAAPINLRPRILPDDISSLGQAQHSSRASSSRHRIIRNPNSNVKLLFIRDTSIPSELLGTSSQSEPNTGVARIQCTDCGRWDFSNLQGFLNHCRIRHQREYGSHDECIQECSVLVASSERDWVLHSGTEITGVGIPSLRRLFEVAVGRKTSLFPIPKPEPPSDQDTSAVEVKEDAIMGEPETGGTYLSRTLGVHEETPALAVILGRRVARRQIRVFNEDEPVDIENCDALPGSNRRWKMTYSHRNLARPELEVDLDLTSDTSPRPSLPIRNTGDGDDNRYEVIPDTGRLESTRFHVTCRIVVTDRSRWLSPEARSPTCSDDTHSWIIAIQSPSYGLDVTRVLSRVTVTCASENSPKSFDEPLVVSRPPFAIESTTDIPFLARVALDWNGQKNAQTVVEHWVQVSRGSFTHGEHAPTNPPVRSIA